MENRRTILKWFVGLPVLGTVFAWFTGGSAAKATEVKPVRCINKKSDLEYVDATVRSPVRPEYTMAFLDGRPVKICVRAHATEGWVECYHPADCRLKRFYGDVLIKVADNQTIQKWMSVAICPWDLE